MRPDEVFELERRLKKNNRRDYSIVRRQMWTWTLFLLICALAIAFYIINTNPERP